MQRKEIAVPVKLPEVLASELDESVKEGKSQASEAAHQAGLRIGEMMEELVRNGVKPDLTAEEYKESLAAAFRLFGIKKE